MAYVSRQSWHSMYLLILLVLATTFCHGSEILGDCSGRFAVEDSTVKLAVQQFVNSTDSLVECRFIFEAPHDSGLLVFANDIRAINDSEIPGCPVTIYSNADASGDPVISLCGHYATMTIPVPSSVALVVYKPEFNGGPYTLTMDFQVTLTGGSNLRACGDSQINAVSTVPMKYSVGFRADAGSGDASDFCDLNVTSNDSAESLGVSCVLTSDGVCNYAVLVNNGSAAESADSVDLASVGGSATVRLHPAGTTGVLVTVLPAGFVPLTSLSPAVSPPGGEIAGTTNGAVVNGSSTVGPEGSLVTLNPDSVMNETEGPMLNVTDYNMTIGVDAANATTVGGSNDDDDDLIPVIIIDYTPTTFWRRTTHWFSETWTTMYYTVTFTYRSFETWVESWF
ncbi:hypothetical protein HPB50_023618 [Hyalomma asiaticum]|uniref:Uncharacterized protein n=1 Tax=Hyalomma asiaticum TaxID=266040 RepID=A0ACB7T8T0_HYAAI|nr:hypothetical protein HPB50_023618 [Hyalomma asiaticum]